MDGGPIQKIQVGVQIVADQDCPWKSELRPDQITTQPEPNNRRHYARHRISFPLELRDERVKTPMRVNATDVSGNGCYVETILPLASGRPCEWSSGWMTRRSPLLRWCAPATPASEMAWSSRDLTPDTKTAIAESSWTRSIRSRANIFERTQ